MGWCQGMEEEESCAAAGLCSLPDATREHTGARLVSPELSKREVEPARLIFFPRPSKEISLEAEKIHSPSIIAFHQRGLNKESFSDCLLGFSVMLVLTWPWGPHGGGWQTWISILVLRSPCCMPATFTCDGKMENLGAF